MNSKRLRLFAGTSNPPLATSICENIGLPQGEIHIQRFSDGEIFMQFQETIRGQDVFVIQSTSAPANDNLMELLISIDAAKRASARQICAVIPYFGYARGDRRGGVRGPIMAELEKKFGLLFEKLKVENTVDIVNRTVKPALIRKELPADILRELA